MSLTVNCCDHLRIKNLLCGCGSKKEEEEEEKKKGEVMYTDFHKQIAILQTPKVNIPELLVLEHQKYSDIHVFMKDSEDHIVFVSVKGISMFQRDDDINMESDLEGKRINECLPDYAQKFLAPIYAQTLEGNPMCLSVLWAQNTYVIRTFYILGHDVAEPKVIAGIMVCSPHTNDFNTDINRFILDVPSKRPSKDKPIRPEIQKMNS